MRRWWPAFAALGVLVLVVGAFLIGRSTAPSEASPTTPAFRTVSGGSPVTQTPPSRVPSPGVPTPGVGPTSAAPTATALGTDPVSRLAWVAESALPPEAQTTLGLIRKGGPYPYPKNDNVTFLNREGLLPKQPSGFYKEYTVVTPGSSDRGARRLVVGKAGEIYYTSDHYASFQRVKEGA